MTVELFDDAHHGSDVSDGSDVSEGPDSGSGDVGAVRPPSRIENFHRRAGRVLLPLICVFLVAFAALGLTGRKADAIGATPIRHTVNPGETLSALSLRYGTTVEAFRTLNRLPNSGRIRAGTELRVPRSASVEGSTSLPLRLANNENRLALRRHTSKWAKKNGIPVDLLEATLWLESGFNQSKVSSTGAVGVGQLMPETSAFIQRSLIGRDLDPTNAEDNIRMSARYLWYLLKMHDGDSTRALQAYYQGQGSIRSNGLYRETIQYARDIQALRRKFR